MPKYVIDPGHGPLPGRGRSSQFGARGPVLGVRECDVTYRVASALARQLGPKACLTRTARDNPSFGERAGRARLRGVQSFLSLHANSGRPGSRGSHAFVHSRASAASLALARSVQRELGGLGFPAPDVTRADMAVLDPEALGPAVPACLVELDFLSDPGGERRLGDPRAIEDIARALARALDGDASPRYGKRRGENAVRPLDEIPAPTFDASDPIGWLRNLLDWTSHYLQFSIGVTDASIFPHSSICHLDLNFADGSAGFGTGFYISPSRILTAGHNVSDATSGIATSIRVRPGRSGAVSISDYTVLDQRFFHPHPSFTNMEDFDLAVIEVPVAPTDGRVFAIEEQRMSPISGVIVCGYAHGEVDPTFQHCDTGSIQEVLAESYTYDIQTRPRSSGSPVFYLTNALDPMATGVQVQNSLTGHTIAQDSAINVGCRLTDAKIDWIWSLGFSLYFDFDSITLRTDPGTTASLAQIVDYLNTHPGKRVDVDGHASPEGDTNHNDDLARGRAEAVATYLRGQRLGARIRNVSGLGSTFGAAHTPAEYDGDRRAVVLPV